MIPGVLYTKKFGVKRDIIMKYKFTKMHGIGNDYIFMSIFDQKVQNPEDLSRRVSDRRFGIGGDGLILIGPAEGADAEMKMYNADGSEAEMCGNGIRCVVKYLFDYGFVNINKNSEISIKTKSGIKNITAYMDKDGNVSRFTVNMGKAVLSPEKIPVWLKTDKIIFYPITIGGQSYDITCVSMGNPHVVVFTENVDTLNLEKIGPLFENHQLFPERINAEFAQVIDANTIKMRVWERGSGETFACGTGSCAVTVAACETGLCKKGDDITVRLKGGDLVVNYTEDRVLMTGTAEKVFEGVIEI